MEEMVKVIQTQVEGCCVPIVYAADQWDAVIEELKAVFAEDEDEDMLVCTITKTEMPKAEFEALGEFGGY